MEGITLCFYKIASKWPKWGSNWQIFKFSFEVFLSFFCSCFQFFVLQTEPCRHSEGDSPQLVEGDPKCTLPSSFRPMKQTQGKQTCSGDGGVSRKERTKKPATCISSWAASKHASENGIFGLDAKKRNCKLSILKYIMGTLHSEFKEQASFWIPSAEPPFSISWYEEVPPGLGVCWFVVVGYFGVLSGLAGCWSHPWALPEYPGQIWPTCRDKKRCTTDKPKEQSALSATSGYEYWLLELSL